MELIVLLWCRDLKPANVFLDKPDPDRYKFYPKVSILDDDPPRETGIVNMIPGRDTS
jgi:hypothetical protein